MNEIKEFQIKKMCFSAAVALAKQRLHNLGASGLEYDKNAEMIHKQALVLFKYFKSKKFFQSYEEAQEENKKEK